MTKRNFIKRTFLGITGLLFSPFLLKASEKKKEKPLTTDAQCVNMAFGHSLHLSQLE